MIKKPTHSISSRRRISSVGSIRRRKSTSITTPSNLALEIELNTPRKPTRSKRSQSMVNQRITPTQVVNPSTPTFISTDCECDDDDNDPLSSDEKTFIDDSKWRMTRKSSYKIAFENTSFNETFDLKNVCDRLPINLFEIGKIIDILKGKEYGWLLQEYLSDYCTQSATSPIFEISHPKKGKHLVFGVYPRLKDSTHFLRYHPILSIIEEYGIDTIYTPIKYTKKSGFNYSLTTLITSTSNHRIKVENLSVIDEEYTIINKEFHRQCEKLFDKILWGKGIWKRIPGVDSVFITQWNTFMRKYRIALETCYLNGDLKGYTLLICIFWSTVLRFKPNSRCKNLSKVLSRRMSYRICRRLKSRLNNKHSTLTLVSMNLLWRNGGIFQTLNKDGWTISAMDQDKILQYRERNECGFDDFSEVATQVQKVAKHAGKVMSWSRNRGNRDSCMIM